MIIGAQADKEQSFGIITFSQLILLFKHAPIFQACRSPNRNANNTQHENPPNRTPARTAPPLEGTNMSLCTTLPRLFLPFF